MENLTTLASFPACDIYYNPQINAIHTRWKGINASGEEFYTIMNKITTCLAEKQSHVIIADASNMMPITETDQQWLIHTWYPAAMAAGFSFQGLIIKPGSENEENLINIVRNYDHNKVKTLSFVSTDEAERWLKQIAKNVSLK